jgi:hypothetical protein
MADMPPRGDAFYRQVFRKTVAGSQEVIQRNTPDLPPRVRTLLVMVDGRTPADALLTRLSALQVNEAAFQMLVDRGLVEPASQPAPTPGAPDAGGPPSIMTGPVTMTPLPASHRGVVTQARGVPSAPRGPATVSMPPVNGAPGAAGSQGAVDLASRKKELYEFFTHTIRELLGLRGYLMQLSVERADSLEDYREIGQKFLAALERSKGPEIARAMRERVERLLR